MSVRAVPMLVASLVSALLATAQAGHGASPDGSATVDPKLGSAFHLARRAAAARLAEPACQVVLDEFTDSRTGRPLSATLEGTGLSAAGFFESLYFVGADARAECRDGASLARTPVGAPVVFVCSTRFQSVGRIDPGMLATVLIHESLHALGLSENPPTSEEITFQVQARCGR